MITKEPVFASARAAFHLEGEIGRRLSGVIDNWILPLPQSNPLLLEMFRLRNVEWPKPGERWAGEFAGKYLSSSVLILRLAGDERLRSHLQWFVRELISLQREDGYFGPWPDGQEFSPEFWDTWGQYHIMMGLILWHETTHDRAALQCARRIADLLCRTFLDGEKRIFETGWQEMNMAPIHSLAVLYQSTGQRRYLDLALEIEHEFELAPAGDYVRCALAGKKFHETPKPRWESIHSIMGLAVLHQATGRPELKRVFEHLWWSMVEGDRHNNGGYSSGEQAVGDPYATGPIETCCTVAFSAMTVEFLKLSSSSIAADELELSLLNSGIGMMSPSCRWVTYNTPMDGSKEASAHSIVFQARAGGPELNCCSVNGPRMLGMISDWALMMNQDGLVLNYYGPGSMEAALPGGSKVVLRQKTDYPRNNRISILLDLPGPERFGLALRIPCWSQQTKVCVNGQPVSGVKSGTYLPLSRLWTSGDEVTLDFDFRPRFWFHRDADKVSIYRGPVLLAFDPAFQTGELPVIDPKNFAPILIESPHWGGPWMLLSAKDAEDREILLADFGSAGNSGTNYVSWLPAPPGSGKTAAFFREDPSRTMRP